MDKEVVVHIHDGIVLSYKKEHIWVSSNEVDETEAYYTEWSKPERETAMQYINTYIWNLERKYCWTYLQGSNQHNILTHIYGIQKDGNDDPICKAAKET